MFLADVLENFRSKCLNTYNLDPTNFDSPPGLAWIAPQKKWNWITAINICNMLLMIGSRVRGGICYSVLDDTRIIVKYNEIYKNLQ